MALALNLSEARIEAIVNASLLVMAKHATAATANASFTAADVVAAVTTDPMGDTARFLACLVAKSVELVNVLDWAEAN